MRLPGMGWLAMLLAVLVAGCGSSGGGGTNASTAGAPAVSAITLGVLPGQAQLSVGQQVRFTAAFRLDGVAQQDVTNAASWNSSDTAVLRVDSPGRVTALAVGTTNLTATLGTTSASAAVTVTSAGISGIAISPNTGKVVGALQFKLVAAFADGSQADATALAQWSSDSPTVLFVGNGDAIGGAQGWARATSLGTTTVRAAYGGFSASQAVQTLAGSSLVSVNVAGNGAGTGDSRLGSTGGTLPIAPHVCSSNGRLVVFSSTAADLVAAGVDNNGESDVFVRDLQTGVTTLVSVNAAGTHSGNGASVGGSITPDGRYVVFESGATDLAGAVPPATPQIYRRDLTNGTTTLISLNGDAVPAPANQAVTNPQVSADGNVVSFTTTATNFPVTGSPGTIAIYVRNLQAGSVRQANLNNGGATITFFNNGAFPLSGDGNLVAFWATLPSTPPGLQAAVYVRNMATGRTTNVGLDTDGNVCNTVLAPVLTDAGEVLFWNTSPAFTAHFSLPGCYARNMTTGAIGFVGPGRPMAASSDGRFVLTQQGEIVITTQFGVQGIVDRQTGVTSPLTVSLAGLFLSDLGANLASGSGLSPDGSQAVFSVVMNNLLDPLVGGNTDSQVYRVANPLVP